MTTVCISTFQKHRLFSVLYESITTLGFRIVSEMSSKQIKLQSVEYEMLLELAKKARMRPEGFLAELINRSYYGKR
jgi:hypothetical protein